MPHNPYILPPEVLWPLLLHAAAGLLLCLAIWSQSRGRSWLTIPLLLLAVILLVASL